MKTNLLITLTSVLVLGNAYAMPTIYPTRPTYLSTITNHTNSNIIADDADQKVIYVMPPNSATSIVSGLHTITANVGFCKEMGDLQSYSREIGLKMKKLKLQMADSKKEIDVLDTKLSEARAEMAEAITVGKLQEIVDLDDRLREVEAQIVVLNDGILKCDQNCQPLKNQIIDLRNERVIITKKRREVASQRTKELVAYEKKKTLVEGIIADKEEKNESWTKFNSKLLSAKNDFIAMYTSFGAMEGARAGLQFKSNWDDNIDLLRQENPGFDFTKITTQNAVISTNIADLDAIPTGGAILGYDIPGARKDGTFTQKSYPENISANIRLSLIGACPILHPEYFDINLPNSKDEMKYGMIVSYEYPTAFLAEVTANYNMYKMYQKIVSSGSKGGFFRSKSWSSVEERNYFKDSFSVRWTEQDSGNSFTDEQRADIERDMRNDIFARLATLGLSGASSTGALVAPPGIPKTGAVVISESLKSTCPGNVYCMGAAITMDVLQAIFGNSSNGASYTSIEDKSLEEKWSRNKVVYKPWVSAYN